MRNVKLALGVALALVLAADTALACGMYRVRELPPEGTILLVKAQELEADGEWRKAARAFDRVIHHPDAMRYQQVAAALGAARTYSAMGWDKTRRLRLKQAARLGRDNPTAQLAYADSIAERYPARALKILKRANTMELTMTEQTDLYALQSIALTARGQVDEAKSALENAELAGVTTESLARARAAFHVPTTQAAPVVAKR